MLNLHTNYRFQIKGQSFIFRIGIFVVPRFKVGYTKYPKAHLLEAYFFKWHLSLIVHRKE